MQVLCQLSYSPLRLAEYSERWRMLQRIPGGTSGGSADVEVDPEEDQEPQEDGEEGLEHALEERHRDVVPGPGDVDADDDVDQCEQAEAAHGSSVLLHPPGPYRSDGEDLPRVRGAQTERA